VKGREGAYTCRIWGSHTCGYEVFWDITPCTRYFGDIFCLHLHMLVACFVLFSRLDYCSKFNIETCSSETSVEFRRTIWHHIPVIQFFITTLARTSNPIKNCVILRKYTVYLGARGSVVGWGTMLQAGRSRDLIPMRWIFFFNWPNPYSQAMDLGSTHPLTEMSTRNIPGGKGRPVREADNLTAMYEPIV
jgi:hypothetical protein